MLGYSVNRQVQKLVLWAIGNLANAGNGVSFNHVEASTEHTNVYIATGDSASTVSVFGVKPMPFVLTNLDLVFNGPVQLTESIIFNGICSVTANGNLIDVNNQSIIIRPGAQVTIYNTILYNMGGGQSLVFLSPSTSSVFLASVQAINTRDFTLNGPLTIDGDVQITGTYKFTYRTNQPSYIYPDAQLYFDSGVTFSYDPIGGASNLLNFYDSTSELYLYETSTYITATAGMVLTNGQLTIDGACPLNSGTLYLGDGTTADNVTLNVLSDSGIIINGGYLISRLAY